MNTEIVAKTLSEQAWPTAPAELTSSFQRQYVEPLGLTTVREAPFNSLSYTGVSRHIYRDWENHTKMWTGPNCVVVTTEPYGLFGDRLAELINDAEAFGFEVTIRAESPHCPGRTILVVLKRPL